MRRGAPARADTLGQVPGALVISLDFELHWGLRDAHRVTGPYSRNLLGARTVIPRILDLFTSFGVHATWAVVGMLGCRGRREWEAFRPDELPQYCDSRLSPYEEPVGRNEQDDALHFAPTLIRQIAQTPGQEIGSHTFSHYYCLEPGQTRSAFAADLRAVGAVHRALGLAPPRAIVLPRNQVNCSYLDVISQAGFAVFRGNQKSWMYQPGRGSRVARARRAGRLLDAYVSLAGRHLTAWEDVSLPNGLCNVPASLFLRPCTSSHSPLARVRRARINRALREAAVESKIFHLWWHPHNFGASPDANLCFLESLLTEFAGLRNRDGMISASMSEVADAARNS